MQRSQLFAVWLLISACGTVRADPPDFSYEYNFIPEKSHFHLSGGLAGFDLDLSIEGSFRLVMGYEYEFPHLRPYASFTDVDAIIFNPLSMAPLPVPGWDLDQTLNLTKLAGTYTDPFELKFSGVEGQGWPIHLTAQREGSLLFLRGNNEAGCCDFFSYAIDAVATLKLAGDFDGNGRVDAADYSLWRSNLSSDSGLSGGGSSHGEYDLWRANFGARLETVTSSSAAVPEPTAVSLATAAGLFCLALLRRTR